MSKCRLAIRDRGRILLLGDCKKGVYLRKAKPLFWLKVAENYEFYRNHATGLGNTKVTGKNGAQSIIGSCR
jgi:hypothetical protein